MAKYQFKDTEELHFELLPEGEYAFKIMDAEEGIQKSRGVTNGSQYIECKIAVGRSGKIVAIIKERIIFHDSMDWKTDQWLRCINFNAGKLGRGDMVDITPETVIGCRGWAKIIQTIWEKKNEKNEVIETKTLNKVGNWLTSKGTLERDMELVALKFPGGKEFDPFETESDEAF